MAHIQLEYDSTQNTRSEATAIPSEPTVLSDWSGQDSPHERHSIRPGLVPDADLLGQMLGSGFADQMWLIQVGGRFIQVTELLYRVAEQCNGEQTYDEIAAAISNSTEWQTSGQDIEYLVTKKLQPIGIMRSVDAEPSSATGHPRTAPSLLRLGLRRGMISADAIEPIAFRLQWLFAPPILFSLLIAGLAAYAWLYMDRGIDGLLANVLYTPGLLLMIFAMQILPGFWHEFGHASALRYGGGHARSIGVGIYVMDPAFYTDVTDSYRLSRAARIRTGLGGIYFDMLLGLVLMSIYWITGIDAVLVLVVLNSINMVYQFMPLIRLDGYWILADLTGVPDFYSMMGAFVRSVLPIPAWKGAKLPPLQRKAKIIFATYTVIAFPSVIIFMIILVQRIPGILRMIWDAGIAQIDGIPVAWRASEWIAVAAHVSQLLLLAVTLIGLTYFTLLIARTVVTLLWRLTHFFVNRRRLSLQMSQP